MELNNYTIFIKIILISVLLISIIDQSMADSNMAQCQAKQINFVLMPPVDAAMGHTTVTYQISNQSNTPCLITTRLKLYHLLRNGIHHPILYKKMAKKTHHNLLLKAHRAAFIYLIGGYCGDYDGEKAKPDNIGMILWKYDNKIYKVKYPGYRCSIKTSYLTPINPSNSQIHNHRP